MNGFATLIADRRAELDLAIEHVASAVGRSAAVLEAWETDRTFPEDPGIVASLAKALDLPAALLAEAYAQSSPNPILSVDEPASAPGEAFAATAHTLVDDVPDSGALVGSGDQFGSEQTDDVGDGDVGDTEVQQQGGSEPLDSEPTAVLLPEGAISTPGPPVIGYLPDQPEIGPAGPRAAYEPPVAKPGASPPPAAVEAAGDDRVGARLVARGSAAFDSLVRGFKRRRWISRAPTSQPSYVEDRKQRTTYQLRTIFTAVAVLLLVLFIRWSWVQFAEAFGTLWQTLVDAV